MSESPPAGEFGLIAWLRSRTPTHGRTVFGIGDDCAVLRPSADVGLLVTTDMLMDGRHFHLTAHGAEAVGRKALGVNLSDIAAMAGRPFAAVVAVALPKQTAIAVAQGLHAGMQPLAERFGVALVGGDTNAWDGPLVVSVTLLGESSAHGPVLRRGAQPGDAIVVTGPLGGSLLGRHLNPQPRVEEGLALVAAVPVHAMIDISDGLASDLGHILEESGGLGAILDESAVPIHADARLMSDQDGRCALEHALHDGEDFELCAALAAEDVERARGVVPDLRRIGTCVREPGLWLRAVAGALTPLPARGFDHLRAEPDRQ